MKKMNIPACLRLFGAALVLLALGGCVSGTLNVRQIDQLASVGGDKPRLLVMTPDVKYYLQTASGMPQPQAEWTEAARRNFAKSLLSFAERRGTRLVSIPEDTPLSEEEIGYQKLYASVGQAILHHHLGQFKLPTKRAGKSRAYAFDWSLGAGVRGIGEKYGADYALFTYYRDYQATGGRIFMAILVAGVSQGHAAMQIGSETGSAALVDLRSGDIVWFNHVTQGRGELRDPGGSDAVVTQLLDGFPDT